MVYIPGCNEYTLIPKSSTRLASSVACKTFASFDWPYAVIVLYEPGCFWKWMSSQFIDPCSWARLETMTTLRYGTKEYHKYCMYRWKQYHYFSDQNLHFFLDKLLHWYVSYLGVNPVADDFLKSGMSSSVNRKWPKWFVPICISNPSSVFHSGHVIIPISKYWYLSNL